MGLLRDFWSSRRARWQADALKAQAEARLHERRGQLAAKADKSHAELVEQRLLESAGSALLMGWGDSTRMFRDLISQLLDFSRGGMGAGAGITTKVGRRGSDYPFFFSEGHLDSHRDFSRLVAQNPNVIGLLGGRRRYTIGSGVTIRATPRGDSPEAKDTAKQAQAVLDDFGKANRFPFRLREFFDQSSIDGEGIWRLFPADDGTTTIRTVYGEQLRCPPGESMEEYEYGVRTDPDDLETVLEYAVTPLSGYRFEPDRVPPEEIVFYAPNRKPAVKRGLPDWTLTTGEVCDLADDLATNMGHGSVNQAAIAYIRQHTGTPASTIRSFATGDASYTKVDPYTGRDINVKRIEAGTIIDTNENTQFLGSPYNAGIEAHASVFQLLINRVSARWNAPKWLATSNNDEVNFASSLTAESPFVQATLEAQEALAEPVRVLHERVLAVAALAGKLPENVLELIEVKITFPSPVARDRQAEADARGKELADGYLSPQQAADQAGYEWAKVVKERKQAQAEGWAPPGGGTGLPGMPGQPNPLVNGNGKPGTNGNGKPPQTTFDHTGARRTSDGLRAGLGEAIGEALERFALQERGFTGTDRLGRKWVDGKEVKKDQSGGGDSGEGAGTSTPPADAPKEAHVWGEIHDALPDEIKHDSTLLGKVRKIAQAVYSATWNFVATQGTDFLPEILDTAQDYEKISYSKIGAQGTAQNDPFYTHLGVPYSAVSVVVSKGLAMAYRFARGRLTAQEAIEMITEGMSDEDRQKIAVGAAKLIAELRAAMGLDPEKVPPPSAEDVAAHVAEREQTA